MTKSISRRSCWTCSTPLRAEAARRRPCLGAGWDPTWFIALKIYMMTWGYHMISPIFGCRCLDFFVILGRFWYCMFFMFFMFIFSLDNIRHSWTLRWRCRSQTCAGCRWPSGRTAWLPLSKVSRENFVSTVANLTMNMQYHAVATNREVRSILPNRGNIR